MAHYDALRVVPKSELLREPSHVAAVVVCLHRLRSNCCARIAASVLRHPLHEQGVVFLRHNLIVASDNHEGLRKSVKDMRKQVWYTCREILVRDLANPSRLIKNAGVGQITLDLARLSFLKLV